MFVQLVFMASGYIIHAGLGRLLGPSAYGVFGVVISIMTLVNILLVNGIPQAGSRFIAVAKDSIGAIMKITMNLQIVLSIAVFALYFLLSPVIAGILGDPSLSGYLRASSFVIPVYALNSLYGGFLNGLRMYGRQGAVLFFSSIAKVVGAVGLVLLGFAIYGAIAGYLLGPLIGLGIGWYYLRDTGKDSNPGNFPYRKIIDFALPLTIFSFALLFLMSIDLFLVKRIMGEDVQAGYYTAASTLSKMPYLILTGLGAALFPAISKSIAMKDTEQTGKYIRESMKYLVLLLLPMVLIISASSSSLIRLFYSGKYEPAAYPLAVLVIGLGAFTIFNILTTVINAAGRPRVPMIMTAVLVPMAVGLNWFLISAYQLNGAAIATTITGLAGMVMASAYIIKMFGPFMEIVSFIRMLLASILTYVIAIEVQVTGPFLILWYAFLFGIYLGILVLVKELNINNLKNIERILNE
jgi:O-antigen/teichoic acid export membrane protein